MASALMRRSAMTALLAALATVASPLVGTGWAAVTAPVEKSTSAPAQATRPTVSVTFDQAVTSPSDPSHPSTLILTDNAAAAPKPNLCGNATLASDPTNKTISCTAAVDLQDNHTYTYTAHVWETSGTMDTTYTNSFTTDIPSEYSQSPAENAVKSAVKNISVTFDEPISTAGGDPNTSNITVDILNSAGHHVQTSGHTSGSNDPNTDSPTPPILGTATWTSDVGGLAPGTYTATFNVFADTSYPTPGANTADYGRQTIHFSVDTTMPPAAPEITSAPGVQSAATGGNAQITSANVKTVHFTGYAAPGFTVHVGIYDEYYDSHGNPILTPPLEGSGPRDGLGSAFVSSTNCSDFKITTSDVKLCHFDVFVDDSKSPDTGTTQTPPSGGTGTTYTEHLQYWAYSSSAAGNVPAAPCPASSTDPTDPCFNKQDPEIIKDSSAPPTPNGADAYWDKASNTVRVENAHDTDPTDADIYKYRVRVTDPEGHQVPPTDVDPGTLSNGWTMGTVPAIDVQTLDDGQLTVTVTAVDNNGNESAPLTAATKTGRPSPTAPNYTLVKEIVNTATVPQDSNTPASLVDTLTSGGVTKKFSDLSSSDRLRTPSSITVYFNEPIRLVFTDSTDPSNPPAKTFSHICLDDSTGPGSCLNNGVGQYSLTSDKRGLIWTAPAGYQVPADRYDVSAFAIADTCQDATPQNPNPPACEMSQQPGDPLTFFNIDEQPPTVHITSVPSPVDGTNVKATTISGTSDGDTTQIVLSIKSSGGGATRVVPISTTPNSGGTGTINWSTTQDLSALPDGTLSLSAVGTDGAGNTTAQADAAKATTTLAARPTAPQNLSATAGNGQAVLTWVAPSYTGGVPLTGYSLTVTDTSAAGSAPQTLSVDPTATTYTVNGLANGHAYSFALTAANSIGSGPAATTSATPKGNTAVSVIASRGTITYGQFLVIHGTLSYAFVGLANEPVTITTVYYNGTHGATYHVTTDQNGNWVVAGLSPAKNVTYVATFAGDSAYNASSRAAGVRVRVLVRILHTKAANSSHLTKVTLSGNVRPNQHGRRVYIYEVLAHGKLHYLGYTKLTTRSTWFFTRAFARGKHTVVARFLTQHGNLGNWSNRARFSRT